MRNDQKISLLIHEKIQSAYRGGVIRGDMLVRVSMILSGWCCQKRRYCFHGQEKEHAVIEYSGSGSMPGTLYALSW